MPYKINDKKISIINPICEWTSKEIESYKILNFDNRSCYVITFDGVNTIIRNVNTNKTACKLYYMVNIKKCVMTYIA